MMMDIPEHIQSLASLLSHVDSSEEAFGPFDMESALRVVMKRNPAAESEAGHAWYDEKAASAMMLLSEEGGPWGYCYAPVRQESNEAGDLITHPDLNRLDTDTVAYWRSRARATQKPILKGIYGDLAWVFAKRYDARPDPEDARLAMDGFTAFILRFSPDQEVDAINFGLRAMSLAVSLKDAAQQELIKTSLFDLARRLEADSAPLYRSFLMDAFGLGRFAKVALSDAEREFMVRLLEDCLEQERQTLEPPQPMGIWDAESAAQMLVTYYRKIDHRSDENRVLEALGEVIHRRADLAEPMAGQSWLESFSRLCLDHGRKDLATQAIQAIQALGPAVKENLKRIGGSVDISVEEVERFVAQFTRWDLASGLEQMAIRMVPDWDNVVATTKDNSRKFVFRFMMPNTLLDGMGRPAVKVPSYHDRPETFMPMAFSEHMQFGAFFRSRVIEAIKEKFHPTPEEIADWLLRSPAFRPERRNLLVHGLRAYLADDHITAIHILIPQIEEAARVAAGLMGESIFKWENEPDGVRRLDARSLNQILNSPRILEVFGQNHTTFLKVALVMHQGMNMRNRVAHGLLLPEEYSQSAADILLHCLLIMGLLKEKPKDSEPVSPETTATGGSEVPS